MKKSLLALLVLSVFVVDNANAGKFGSSSRSFLSSRSSFVRSTPRYIPPPRPMVRQNVVVQRNTVVHQHNTTQGTGMMGSIIGTMVGAGVGSYVGSSLAQPSNAPPPPTTMQYPYCPNPVPKGYNTPCLAQPQ